MKIATDSIQDNSKFSKSFNESSDNSKNKGPKVKVGWTKAR